MLRCSLSHRLLLVLFYLLMSPRVCPRGSCLAFPKYSAAHVFAASVVAGSVRGYLLRMQFRKLASLRECGHGLGTEKAEGELSLTM
jgi:hypothetical protein